MLNDMFNAAGQCIASKDANVMHAKMLELKPVIAELVHQLLIYGREGNVSLVVGAAASIWNVEVDAEFQTCNWATAMIMHEIQQLKCRYQELRATFTAAVTQLAMGMPEESRLAFFEKMINQPVKTVLSAEKLENTLTFTSQWMDPRFKTKY